MKQLVNTLFLLFVFHILVSLVFIVSPSFLKGTRFARIYKAYLLPGPFFSNDTITTTYNYLLSWKRDGEWSEVINPSKKYFNKYYENFNPSNLYISRYTRSMSQQIFFQGLSQGETKQFSAMGPFVIYQYTPNDTDSIRLVASKKTVVGFTVKINWLMTPEK